MNAVIALALAASWAAAALGLALLGLLGRLAPPPRDARGRDPVERLFRGPHVRDVR
jgi:hypothetical protein